MQQKGWHKIVVAGFFLVSFAGSAQQINSRGGAVSKDTAMNALIWPKKDTVLQHKVLIIPFESKMLMSEIGKDVNAKTHQSYPAITEEFRKELDLAMFGAIRKSCSTVSLLDGKQRSDSTLTAIYAATSYSYDIVPGTAPESGATDKNGNGRYIKNGQIQVPVDYSQRFMNVTLLNQNLLSDLSSKYHTDTYVFINEMDIKNVDNNSTNLSDDAYRREVVIHYSILDNNGHYVNKGIATTFFPYHENDPKVIGEKYFTVVAKQILNDYVQGLVNDKKKEEQKNQKAQSKGLFK